MKTLREIWEEIWRFYRKTLILVFTGSKEYYLWCLFLLSIMVVGFFMLPATTSDWPNHYQYERPGGLGSLYL